MRRAWPAAACIVGALASGCAPTARTSGPYRSKAIKAAEAIQSAVGSDLLLLDQAVRGRMTAAYVSVATSEAEDDASSAAFSFLSIQPPGTSSEQLRNQL